MEAVPLAIPPDSLLLEGLARGEEAAFEALFLRYYSQVYGILFRLLGDRQEAEDLAQEVFLKLHRQRFSPGRDHSLGGWLYRVATNIALNRLRGESRRERRETAVVVEGQSLGAGAVPDPAHLALRQEEREMVRRALAQLPLRSRACLVLRQVGLSYAEIARALDVAPSSVGTLLARAEERLRAEYLALRGEEG